MGTPEDINNALNQGAGIEASMLGQKFNIYRFNELIYTNIPVYVERSNDRKAIEAAISLRNIMLVHLKMDGKYVQPGDVIQGADATDRFVVASKRLLRPIIGYRTDTPVTIRRPVQPSQITNPDTSIEPYSGIEKPKAHWLTYNSTTNLYAFQDPTTPGISEAVVYAGRSQLNYTGSTLTFKLPTDTRTTRWIFVMEIFPGVKIQEGDHVIYDNDHYEVYSVDKQIAGFNGQILSCDLVKP